MTQAAGSDAGAPFTEPAPQSNPPGGGGVLGEVSGVISAAQRSVSGYFDLIVLEARRAGLSLVWMIALGFGAAILGVTAWMGIVAALALWAVAAGLSPILAVLLMVVLNLAGAGAAVFACLKFSKDLTFAASRRQLAKNPASTSPQPTP